MPACLCCGKKIEADYLLWKGGENRSFCEKCNNEEEFSSIFGRIVDTGKENIKMMLPPK